MTENDTAPDENLRQLFANATADVRPEGTFEDVLTRIRRDDPVARRWFLPAVAAAAVVGLIVGGALWVTRDDDHRSPGPAKASPPVMTTIYYVGGVLSASHPGRTGHGLYSEAHEVPSIDGKPDPVAAANLALGGTPADPDYSSLWPAGTSVTSVVVQGTGTERQIVVRLAGSSFRERPKGMNDRDQMLAIDALTRTLVTAEGGDRTLMVRFDNSVGNGETVLGEDTMGEAFGDGGDDTGQLAPVQITNIVNGQTVPAGDLEVKGLAATFEANVVWELVVGGDAVVQSGHTTAAECCSLQPYSFTIKDLQPGTYTLVVHDTDESGEGRAVNQDTKEITVE